MTKQMTWSGNACYPFTIGFDELFFSLDTLASHNTSYPPHNIVRTDTDKFQLEMAVAGFAEDEISITVDKRELIVKGAKKPIPEDADHSTVPAYIHRGIATRDFTKKFEIAEFIEVKGAYVENGMLIVELEREIPEELKPKQIPIGKKQLLSE